MDANASFSNREAQMHTRKNEGAGLTSDGSYSLESGHILICIAYSVKPFWQLVFSIVRYTKRNYILAHPRLSSTRYYEIELLLVSGKKLETSLIGHSSTKQWDSLGT